MTLALYLIEPPSAPVSAIVVNPNSLALSTALTTLILLPLVERAKSTSPFFPNAST